MGAAASPALLLGRLRPQRRLAVAAVRASNWNGPTACGTAYSPEGVFAYNVVMQPERRVTDSAVLDFHLLGQVALQDCLALQRRLVFEAGERNEPRVVVLLCEHPEVITVGRRGSRGDIRLSNDELAERRIEVRWLGRGGGCILHTPGQLAVYPIVPLANFGWTVGEYLRRVQQGLVCALAEFDVSAQSRPGRFGVWGRTGQLAVVAAAVQFGVAWQGAFVNVNPVSRALGFVETNPARWKKEAAVDPAAPDKAEMSSLLAERGRPVKMTRVRTAIIESLAATWGCEEYHLFTGHSFLTSIVSQHREPTARAS